MFETKLSLEQRIARTQDQLKKAKDNRRRATIKTVKLERKLTRQMAQQLTQQVTQSQAATEIALAPAPPPGAKVRAKKN